MVLVSFDIVSVYLNISSKHSLRTILCKLLNRTTNVPSTECTVDAKLCRTYLFVQKQALPSQSKVVIKELKQDACDYTDIAMDEVDHLLMNFKFNNLALQEYGGYRDDTFTPWSHGLDN